MTTTLDDFVPEERAVSWNGRTVAVRPLTLAQFPAFARAVAPVLPALLSGQIVPALVEHPDRVVAAIAAATGVPEAELRAGDPAEFVGLAEAAIGINADFFARRLLPAAKAAEAAILARTAQAFGAETDPTGASPSPGSAPAATPSAT